MMNVNAQMYTVLETERRGQKVVWWAFEYIEQFRQQLASKRSA